MLIRRAIAQGMSLIELMVGVALGLFMIIVITQFFSGQVIATTDLLETTRLNQDLRAIMDLMVRDIRRAGYWGNSIQGVWYEGSTAVTPNPGRAITIGGTSDPSTATSGNSIRYSYDENGDGTIEDSENFTIQLNNHVVELVRGLTNQSEPTPLSDPDSTTITNLANVTNLVSVVAPVLSSDTPATVPITCIYGGSNPTLTVREITIELTGRLTHDPTVTRTMRETVRIRADNLAAACSPAPP